MTKKFDLSNIVSTKGNAAPAADLNQDSNEKRTAVTVKLDKHRFRALKMYGLENNMTNQDVFVKALDLLLSGK